MIEVFIMTDDWFTVLAREGGNPDIVLWQRPAGLTQLIPNLGIDVRCHLVDSEHD